MNLRIEHPTDRPNFSIIHLDGVSLAFSYTTVVGIRDYGSMARGWQVRENDWGPTTGKHLNYLDDHKERRIPSEQFDNLLSQIQFRRITNNNLR